MNTLALSMVKNEADIVEAFVRHNLEFLDLLVVIDNGSTDGTREILDALQREGLPVLVFDDPIFGYWQSEKMTHVYRKVVPVFDPELVWLLDADEFIHAPSRAAVETALGQVPAGGTVLVPWRTHVPNAQVDPARVLADPLGAMPDRRRREEPVYYKALLRRDPRDDARLVIEQGNHQVHLADGGRPPTCTIDGAAIAHLPVRSLDQLSAKVINGWQAYLVKNRHAPVATAGFQWQQLYERLVHGEGLDGATLATVALDYAQSPRPGRNRADDTLREPVPSRYGCLRYAHLARTGLLARIALNMESFILNGDGTERPTTDLSAAPRRDISGLLDVLRRTQATRLAGAPGSAGPQWVAELAAANPGWRDVTSAAAPMPARHADDRAAPGGDDTVAHVLLAPDLDVDRFAALAADAARHPSGRVVWWPAAAPSAAACEAALLAWYRAGWEPQMLETLGYRALSAFAELRRGAFVLQRVQAAPVERAGLVRTLLCDATRQPPAAATFEPRQVLHPMQDMPLQALAA